MVAQFKDCPYKLILNNVFFKLKSNIIIKKTKTVLTCLAWANSDFYHIFQTESY